MDVIQCTQLCKYYGKQPAVDHLNMAVPQGSIYGFIGRNGSGKSTTLKMLCGLASASQGEILIFGKPAMDEIVCKRIGTLIENAGIYPNFSAYDNLWMKAVLIGLTDRKKSVGEMMELTGLAATGGKKASQFSMGMKQRLGMAMAMLGRPDLLILDEPINGLDPEGIREIREIILRLNREFHMTILLSSHILGELSKVATHYGIIKSGHMVRELTAEALEDECRDYLHIKVDAPKQAAVILEEKLNIQKYEVHPAGEIRIYGSMNAQMVSRSLSEERINIEEMYLHKQELEQYFLELMDENTAIEGGGNHDESNPA